MAQAGLFLSVDGTSTYGGAVFPTDLCVPLTTSDGRHMKTLVDLCAENIVQESERTESALKIIPKTLCESFMKETLSGTGDAMTFCILNHWPYQTLVLRNHVPRLLSSIKPMYDLHHLNQTVAHGCRYTSLLIVAFLQEFERKHRDSNIKLWDLCGFPTEEGILHLLCRYCIIAYTEAFRDTFNQAVGPSNEQNEDSADQSTNQGVVMKVDSFVSTEDTHLNLCKALKISRFQYSRINLIVGRLSIFCLDESHIISLLKQIDSRYLTGLQIRQCKLSIHDFILMASELKSLINLEALDISYEGFVYILDYDSCHSAAAIFGSLPHLCRLDLSQHSIGSMLHILLKNMVCPLTYLNLSGCGLDPSDLEYLSHSIHCSQLVELYLSRNDLSMSGEHLSDILMAAKSSLCVLQVDDCHLTNAIVSSLLSCLRQMSSLVFFSCKNNPLSSVCQVSLLEILAELSAFQLFQTSYAVDCYGQPQSESLKSSFHDHLMDIASKSCVRLHRRGDLKLELTELRV